MKTAKHRSLKKANINGKLKKTKKNKKAKNVKKVKKGGNVQTNKKEKGYKKYVGGGEITKILKGDAPPINRIANFVLTLEDIRNFTRYFTLPVDCSLSALQFMGILSNKETEVLRIAMHGLRGIRGFLEIKIELIAAIKSGFNFEFIKFADVDTWGRYLTTYLPIGTGVLSGYSGHVFIIFHGMDDKMYLIDPQIPLHIMGDNPHVQGCELTNPECYKYLKTQSPPFSVLCSSNERLSVFQGTELTKHINELLNDKSSLPPNNTITYNPSQPFIKDVVPFNDDGSGPIEIDK
jgi:hypothetical protein